MNARTCSLCCNPCIPQTIILVNNNGLKSTETNRVCNQQRTQMVDVVKVTNCGNWICPWFFVTLAVISLCWTLGELRQRLLLSWRVCQKGFNCHSSFLVMLLAGTQQWNSAGQFWCWLSLLSWSCSSLPQVPLLVLQNCITVPQNCICPLCVRQLLAGSPQWINLFAAMAACLESGFLWKHPVL